MRPTDRPLGAQDAARGAPLAPPPTHVASPLERAESPSVGLPSGQEPHAGAPPVEQGSCGGCKGSGRVFWSPQGQAGPRTVEVTPCPRCRPEASVITASGRLKDAEGRKAAHAARQRGL